MPVGLQPTIQPPQVPQSTWDQQDQAPPSGTAVKAGFNRAAWQADPERAKLQAAVRKPAAAVSQPAPTTVGAAINSPFPQPAPASQVQYPQLAQKVSLFGSAINRTGA